jgi:ligand-binding sensor domain-containing protein/signal transduction histidine kinase
MGTSVRSVWQCAVALLLGSAAAWALDPHKAITQLAHSSWRDELPQNTIHTTLQTRDGYLWFGTYEGLVRFDGVRFVVFDAARSKDLRGTSVVHLAEDAGGRLWIATNGGLTVREDARFQTYTTAHGLPSDVVTAVLPRPDGTLVVGTDRGLCRFSGGRCSPVSATGPQPAGVKVLVPDGDDLIWVGTDRGLFRWSGAGFAQLTTADGLPSNLCRAVLRSRDGTLWVATSAGLWRQRDGDTRVLTVADGLPDSFVAALWEDRDGSLWIGTEGGGLTRLAGGRFATYSEREGLIHNYVRSIYEDREGNLWVGTNGGLNQLRDSKVATYTTREGLAADFARVVLEDSKGDVWVGTDGGGLCRFRAGQFTCLGTADGLPSASVRALGMGRAGVLWVGTRSGLSRLDGSTFTTLSTREGLSSNLVRAVLEDRKGVVWVGTEGGGLNRIQEGRIETFSVADGLPSNDVRALHEGPEGELWIGTYGGLVRWEAGVQAVLRTTGGLPNDIVFAITNDRRGNLWVGTDGGLALVEPSHVTAFTIDDGLHDNKVFQILEDEAGFLWMSSNRGISRVRVEQLYARAAGQPVRLDVQKFDRSDGLRVNQCNGSSQPAGWRTRAGELWFPTAEGVAVVTPRLMRFNAVPPPVLIEEVVVNRSRLPAGPVRELPPGTRELELHYTALSYVAPERVRFRYRLEGFDPRWVEAGGRRSAYFTSIPPGRYRFQVLACNNDDVWNETGASWTFAIRAPLWQRWWAYLLYVLLAAGTVSLGVKLRISALKHRTRLLEAKVAERTVEVEQTNRALAEKVVEAEASERRAVESEQRALEASRAKSIFLSNMSHELRTPLNSIIGFAAIVMQRLDGQIDPRYARFLRNIHTSGEHLLRLINTILDLSKIEAGRMELHLEELLMRGVAAESDIDIEVRAPELLPAVMADAIKLKQVMFNLLSNAVKFSPPRSTVVVQAQVVSEDSSPLGVESLRIDVVDRGIGIRFEDQEIIFQEFRQLDEGASRRFQGTGLGLPLARRLMELHGGTVLVDSLPGWGSTFSVLLPVVLACDLRDEE